MNESDEHSPDASKAAGVIIRVFDKVNKNKPNDHNLVFTMYI